MAVAAACSLFACSAEETRAKGRLAAPVAIVTAPSSADGALDGRVLFVASGDDAELRAFLPASGLFVRGPNAVSPLSIPTGFRPQSLASGEVEGKGFAVAAGGGPSLATVSADTFRLTAAAGDEAACAADQVTASCLGQPAVAVSASELTVVAALGGDGTASPGLALLTPVLEDGVPVLILDSVVTLDFEPAAVTLSSDASRAWVSDATVARVVEVALPGGALTPIATAATVRRIVEVPAYTDANDVVRPGGEFLLAILSDGRVQTLDAAVAEPAEDPLTPGQPLTPLSVPSKRFVYQTPVRDLVFVPCKADAACRSALRVSSSRTDDLPLVAMAALGDGTVLPLVPDATFPQIFRPIDLANEGATASSISFSGNSLSEQLPVLTLDAASLTEGVTQRETVTVTYRGVVPGFSERRGTLTAAGLDDAQGGLSAPDVARVGDFVAVRFVGGDCPEPIEVEVTSVADTVLGLASSASAACSEVVYSLIAAADAPWTVFGGVSGYFGRTASDVAFVAEGQRFFYPINPVAGPAFEFTITGDDPAAGAQFSFTTYSGLSALTLLEDPDRQRAGLADAVTALPGLVFVGSAGEDALVALDLARQGVANGTVFFR